MNTPEISVVIPVYNEFKRLLHGLQTIWNHLHELNYQFEMVVVDDGSIDGSLDIALQFASNHSEVRVVKLWPNQGKGTAVKKGMLSSNGIYRLFTDVDLSVPISETLRFINALKDGADVAISTRRAESSDIIIHQSYFRETLGDFFRRIVRRLFAPQITDFTCGFKGFSEKAAEYLFSKSAINRWAFDVEILSIAVKQGFHVEQIPIEWTNSPVTKVKLSRDIFGSLYELIKIWWRLRFEKY